MHPCPRISGLAQLTSLSGPLGCSAMTSNSKSTNQISHSPPPDSFSFPQFPQWHHHSFRLHQASKFWFLIFFSLGPSGQSIVVSEGKLIPFLRAPGYSCSDFGFCRPLPGLLCMKGTDLFLIQGKIWLGSIPIVFT